MEGMSEVLTMITNNGFAIFVAAYMLIVQNKNTQLMTEALNNVGAQLKELRHDIEDVAKHE